MGKTPAAGIRSGSGRTEPLDAYGRVVVGGGSAGCVVASRLAAQSGENVLLVEAGVGGPAMDDHPRDWALAMLSPACRTYETVPQPGTCGRSHLWPRGVGLGGSSAINALIFARGDRLDFDAWAYAGCAGWDHASLLPIFRAMEDFEGGADEHRGAGGPLHISTPRPGLRHPCAEAFHAAAVDLGFPPNPDINGARLGGVGWADLTIRDGRRQSAYRAFLEPALGLANLDILTGAPVERLSIENGRCSGIVVRSGTGIRDIRCDGEVIVAAGALESPRLLMLSGIGPADHLRGLGIDVVLDAPEVGANLQDHLFVAGLVHRKRRPMPDSHYNRSEVYLWTESDGRLISPDLIIHLHSRVFSLSDTGLEPDDGFTILPGLARPHSRGTVRLSSADPDAPLIIDPAYLSAERDLDALVRAAEICREIGGSAAIAELSAGEVWPGQGVSGRKALAEFIRAAAHTFFHPTSTCRMGVDTGAVVDPDLRVHGIEGLRVADASVMPTITAANTNAPAMMIGWKCADLITGAQRTASGSVEVA